MHSVLRRWCIYRRHSIAIVNPLTAMADRSQMPGPDAKPLQWEAPSRQKGACRPRWRRLGSKQAHTFEGCMMKRVISVLGLALAVGLERAGRRPDPQDGQGPRVAHLRRQPGPAGLFQSRRQGQLDRARRRLLPRHRGGDLQRPDQGQVHAAVRQGSLRAAQGRARSTCSRATPPGPARATRCSISWA